MTGRRKPWRRLARAASVVALLGFAAGWLLGRSIHECPRDGPGDPRSTVSIECRIVARPGDTLGGLAEEHLGSASRWEEIHRANEGTLDDPDMVRVGVRLKVPCALNSGLGEK